MIPRTRGECLNGPRPCPHTTCRYHLASEIKTHRKGRTPTRPRSGPDALNGGDTCALDVADRGGEKLETIGDILGVTRERVRQIEQLALLRIARHAAYRHRRELAKQTLDELDEIRLRPLPL